MGLILAELWPVLWYDLSLGHFTRSVRRDFARLEAPAVRLPSVEIPLPSLDNIFGSPANPQVIVTAPEPTSPRARGQPNSRVRFHENNDPQGLSSAPRMRTRPSGSVSTPRMENSSDASITTLTPIIPSTALSRSTLRSRPRIPGFLSGSEWSDSQASRAPNPYSPRAVPIPSSVTSPPSTAHSVTHTVHVDDVGPPPYVQSSLPETTPLYRPPGARTIHQPSPRRPMPPPSVFWDGSATNPPDIDAPPEPEPWTVDRSLLSLIPNFSTNSRPSDHRSEISDDYVHVDADFTPPPQSRAGGADAMREELNAPMVGSMPSLNAMPSIPSLHELPGYRLAKRTGPVGPSAIPPPPVIVREVERSGGAHVFVPNVGTQSRSKGKEREMDVVPEMDFRDRRSVSRAGSVGGGDVVSRAATPAVERAARLQRLRDEKDKLKEIEREKERVKEAEVERKRQEVERKAKEERERAELKEKERLEREAEREEKERIRREQEEKQEQERLKLEEERQEAERLRMERESAEAERLEKEEAKRREVERLRTEAERLRMEEERLESEKREKERLKREEETKREEERRKEEEIRETERLKSENLERERVKREEDDRQEQERARKNEERRRETERLEKERSDAKKEEAKLNAIKLQKEADEAEAKRLKREEKAEQLRLRDEERARKAEEKRLEKEKRDREEKLAREQKEGEEKEAKEEKRKKAEAEAGKKAEAEATKKAEAEIARKAAEAAAAQKEVAEQAAAALKVAEKLAAEEKLATERAVAERLEADKVAQAAKEEEEKAAREKLAEEEKKKKEEAARLEEQDTARREKEWIANRSKLLQEKRGEDGATQLKTPPLSAHPIGPVVRPPSRQQTGTPIVRAPTPRARTPSDAGNRSESPANRRADNSSVKPPREASPQYVRNANPSNIRSANLNHSPNIPGSFVSSDPPPRSGRASVPPPLSNSQAMQEHSRFRTTSGGGQGGLTRLGAPLLQHPPALEVPPRPPSPAKSSASGWSAGGWLKKTVTLLGGSREEEERKRQEDEQERQRVESNRWQVEQLHHQNLIRAEEEHRQRQAAEAETARLAAETEAAVVEERKHLEREAAEKELREKQEAVERVRQEKEDLARSLDAIQQDIASVNRSQQGVGTQDTLVDLTTGENVAGSTPTVTEPPIVPSRGNTLPPYTPRDGNPRPGSIGAWGSNRGSQAGTPIRTSAEFPIDQKVQLDPRAPPELDENNSGNVPEVAEHDQEESFEDAFTALNPPAMDDDQIVRLQECLKIYKLTLRVERSPEELAGKVKILRKNIKDRIDKWGYKVKTVKAHPPFNNVEASENSEQPADDVLEKLVLGLLRNVQARCFITNPVVEPFEGAEIAFKGRTKASLTDTKAVTVQALKKFEKDLTYEYAKDEKVTIKLKD